MSRLCLHEVANCKYLAMLRKRTINESYCLHKRKLRKLEMVLLLSEDRPNLVEMIIYLYFWK